MNSKGDLNKSKYQRNLRCKKNVLIIKMCSMVIKKGQQQYLPREKRIKNKGRKLL